MDLIKKNKLFIGIFLFFTFLGVALLLKQRSLTRRQELIHERGALVMPFDLDRTTHYFSSNENGGAMQVRSKDPNDKEQVDLVRAHLKEEAENFKNADFSDPKTLHGENMPGLDVLSSAQGKFSVEYQELPDGAQLAFNTKDPDVANALHMWFMAQMTDHGPDAASM